ncbi:MAG: hypothetical protein JXB32_25010 [Deltaproteobacteria bacterium]|nr:hypothetical protein [Deltaproteobacteria bacterium]
MTSNRIRTALIPLVVGLTAARAEAQVPPPPTDPAGPAPAAAAPAAPATAEPVVPAAEPPRQLEVGSSDGFFRPGILMQGWYTAEFLGTGADEIDNTFRIRRAEISAQGEIVPGWLRYKLMIDPAKVLEFGSATIEVENQDPPPTDPADPEQVTVRQPVSAVSMFQDFFVTFLVPYVEISIGQFKIPVSWEGFGSSSRLLLPERAAVSRRFGDRRDLGLMLAKKFEWFGYTLGLYNGAGQNNFDTNNTKDVALRLEAYPFDGLTIAGVAYLAVGDRDQPGTRDRYEGDLRFDYAGFLFQGEYIYAHDVDSSGTDVHGHGFYAAVAYTIADLLQPCVRVGYLDPDLDQEGTGSTDELWQIDAGLNWFVHKHEAKLQLSYSRLQYDERTAGNQVILSAQASY